jgi:CelD/BcsL family acetyltransferase involved in cellulose biosynthesis
VTATVGLPFNDRTRIAEASGLMQTTALPIDVVSRGAVTSTRCDIVDAAWLEARAESWDHLVLEAATPNPFYARRIVLAHIAHGLASPELRFVAVHRGERLLALLPYDRARLGVRTRANAGWTSPYVVTSTPLIAQHGLTDHVEALLEGLRLAGNIWLLPLLSLESRAGSALQSALAARGWPSQTVATFSRPVLDGRDAEAYEAHVGRRRRKDLRRRSRRLAELGRLKTKSFCSGDGLRQAIEDFLALEARGWKGAGGTALACRPNTASYLRAAFADADGPVACRADVLSLDDRPIAISLALVSGGTAYMFKTAYDETLGRHAPGVILEDEIVRIRRETDFAERLNSATMPGGVLDALYPHREPIGDLLFATDRSTTAPMLASLARREILRRHALAHMKGLYRRLRAACQPTPAKGLASVEAK